MLPEKLQLIELTAHATQTKLFSMNCNNNNNMYVYPSFPACGFVLVGLKT